MIYKFVPLLLLALLFTACEEPVTSSNVTDNNNYTVDGLLWRCVAIEEDGIRKSISVKDTLSEIRLFSEGICSTYYNSNFPTQAGEYNNSSVNDTTLVLDPNTGLYVRTGEIKLNPYSLINDTLKIEQSGVTSYYVIYDGSFPPAEWNIYVQKLERNSFVGRWIVYNSLSDGKYKVTLEFAKDYDYYEIFQYYEAVSYLPDEAFEPDTHFGRWYAEENMLSLKYRGVDSTFMYSYEISTDTLKFSLWDEEWGNTFERIE